MFRVELLTFGLEVVGFFEVARTTPIASLPAKVEEALKARGVQSAVYWQVKCPNGRVLFRKVQIVNLEEK